MAPPFASTKPRLIARPKPEPDPVVPVTRKNGSNTLARSRSGIPRPALVTHAVTVSSDRSASSRIGELGGENLTAFSIRFENTRSSCAASARIEREVGGESKLDRALGADVCGCRCNHVMQVAPVRLRRDRARLDLRQVEQVVHHPRQPAGFGVDHVTQLGALGRGQSWRSEARDRGRDRRQRRAQVVRDRVQDRGPSALRPPRRFCFGGLLGEAVALERQVNQPSERLGQALDVVGGPCRSRSTSSQATRSRVRKATIDPIAGAGRAPAPASLRRCSRRSRSRPAHRCCAAGRRDCPKPRSPTRPRRSASPPVLARWRRRARLSASPRASGWSRPAVRPRPPRSGTRSAPRRPASARSQAGIAG